MMVARRTRGVRVRKPPKEESAGGVTKLERQKHGDPDAGGLLPGCVDPLWEAVDGAASAVRDRQNRRRAAAIERQDGCSGLREGEPDHCWSGGSDTEGPR